MDTYYIYIIHTITICMYIYLINYGDLRESQGFIQVVFVFADICKHLLFRPHLTVK